MPPMLVLNDGVVDGVQGALSEGRERSHLLDLVTEELDAKRLTARAREDVDETAAHGDLSSLVHPLDALVAGERKRLHELVEAELRVHGKGLLDHPIECEPLSEAALRLAAQRRGEVRSRQ